MNGFYSTVGDIPVNKYPLNWTVIESRYKTVVNGSHRPEKCTARHKVALLIPYRNRARHLRIFLNHMHAFLIKQQLDYGIYIVEIVGPHIWKQMFCYLSCHGVYFPRYLLCLTLYSQLETVRSARMEHLKNCSSV